MSLTCRHIQQVCATFIFGSQYRVSVFRESVKFKKTYILKARDMSIRLHWLVASLVYPCPRDQDVHSTNQSSNLLKLYYSVFRYKRLPVLVRSLPAWRLWLFVQRRESFSNYESSCNQDEKTVGVIAN